MTARSLMLLPVLVILGTGLLPPGAARADDADNYTMEEVQACSGDAIQFCADVLTDNHKIEACMLGHKAQLSRACRTIFDRESPVKP